MGNYIESIPKRWKLGIKLGFDTLIALLSLLIALGFSMKSFVPIGSWDTHVRAFVAAFFLALLLGVVFRIYSIRLTSFSFSSVKTLLFWVLSHVVLLTAANIYFHLGVSPEVPALSGLIMICLSIGLRAAFRHVLEFVNRLQGPMPRVLIYGAGASGQQLTAALNQSREMKVVGFVDDNWNVQNLEINGVRVGHSSHLSRLIDTKRADTIILSIPSLALQRRRRILGELSSHNVRVLEIPSLLDLASGRAQVTQFRSVDPESLLDREEIDLQISEVREAFTEKSILVTGAGGSIGSEICRQLFQLQPKRLVLYENSEFNLYRVEAELRQRLAARPVVDGETPCEIIAVLGSVTDRDHLMHVMRASSVQVLFHAAAYKHVPLVEANPLPGIKNNIFGTRTASQVAGELNIERFVLVSTDKAVRPTNVMGATKRIAEFVVYEQQQRFANTIYSTIRFGNVVGSSGSVIPLWQKQIGDRLPLTITHRDVRRYFMTINEAAQLVLLAGAVAKPSDLFVLDMGKEVRLIDMARKMISLSGLTEDEIPIREIGLRPGEKLYEELLVDRKNMQPTLHPKILRATESDHEALDLNELDEITKDFDDGPLRARRWLEKYVEGFKTKAS